MIVKARPFIALLLAVLGALIVSMQPVYAWNPFGQVDCSGDASSSAVCSDRSSVDPITGSDGLILRIADFVAVIGGIIAVIIIILAGLRFVTANGSSDDVSGARRTLVYAVVGLVVIVLARTIVQLVLSNV